jgi:surface polysaccharide O-acyltransferase-like enzyme
MSKFWSWYDGLAKNDGTLRFLIFFIAILIMYLVIPLIIGMVYGMQYVSPASIVGVVIMGLLALTKHFRWPK